MIYSRIINAKDDREALNIIADLLFDHSGRLATVVRQLDAEAADGVRAYLRKKAGTERHRHARTVKKGRTDVETTYNEIQDSSFHYLATYTDDNGFSELGFLGTIALILIDYIDGSKGRTQADLEAIKFALIARCRFLHKESENMAEALEHFRNETAGIKDKKENNKND